MQQVRAFSAALGDERPDGLLHAVVGEADGAVLAVEIWATQADADRFVAERLHPAFLEVGVVPDDRTTIVGFEAVDVYPAPAPAGSR
ncbi:hypothetical protein [Pseudonocardia broussonetiae]|uniref:ABM domain-containing protein n=1 Tax=Pseudonocardia broussonetiae TaxID=2736640 RepID=A0A6M6JKN3_9PSEU|nr:hypothetical protein [Pseudonocardia broussonetiae]QJY47916.1 hypothetical protein HOP40_20680 [Pseudonocardia broussonetiae]